MKGKLRKYMVNYYCTDDKDVIAGEKDRIGFEYCSDEAEAESSSLAIYVVMNDIVEQIYDCSEYRDYREGIEEPVIALRISDELVECIVEQTEDEINIRDLDRKIIKTYYYFFVDSLIGEALDETDLTVRDMSELFEIPIKTLELWIEGQPVSPDWAEDLILEKPESMK